jgi:hypothetical protein
LPRSLLLKCGGVAAVLVAVASPLPLFAGEGLYLDWGLCGPTGAVQQSFACDSNIGSENLYCAFTLATPLDQVLGVEIVIDIVHSQSVLPSWWQLGVGGCRYGALAADGQSPPNGDCATFWAGQETGGIQLYEVGQPRNAANQARIVVALSLLPPDARTLAAGTLYYAARVLLENQNTTGAGSCSGCGGDACLVLNSIRIKRLPGAVGGDVLLEQPAPDGGNMATWQGTAANCAAVPVHVGSWGRIKALYR